VPARELKAEPRGKPRKCAKGLNSRRLSTISTAGGWRGRAKGAGQTLTLNLPNLPTGAALVAPSAEQEGGLSAGLPAVCIHSVHAAGGFGGHVEELSFDGA
jgi:hypothetical protein